MDPMAPPLTTMAGGGSDGTDDNDNGGWWIRTAAAAGPSSPWLFFIFIFFTKFIFVCGWYMKSHEKMEFLHAVVLAICKKSHFHIPFGACSWDGRMQGSLLTVCKMVSVVVSEAKTI